MEVEVEATGAAVAAREREAGVKGVAAAGKVMVVVEMETAEGVKV